MDIKVGNTVLILTGKDRGKQGKVESLNRAKGLVVVTGLNIVKRHLKPSSKYPAGGIIELARPINQSNLRVIESEGTSSPKDTKKIKG